ncbi:MAG: D-glycero-alpha-D-manno-heptose-1,7-bisphosphate 7-phosphatase [bacterium]
MFTAAVFLDRDGVLNEALVRDGRPYTPARPEDVTIVPGAANALAALKRAGFRLICVTNQPDVGRGLQTRDDVEAINRVVMRALPLDDILVCYHRDEDGCSCRKPRPGLLLDAAARHALDLGRSFMIGDRWRDIDAAHAAGCRSVLLDYGYAERGPVHRPDRRVRTIGEAAAWILDEAKREETSGAVVR